MNIEIGKWLSVGCVAENVITLMIMIIICLNFFCVKLSQIVSIFTAGKLKQSLLFLMKWL